MKIKYEPEFNKALDKLEPYSIANFGKDVASKYSNKIEEAIERIKNNPEMFVKVGDKANTRRYLPHNTKHYLYYEYIKNEDTVVFKRIIHSSRNQKELIKIKDSLKDNLER